jgi:hypothetical protein
MDVTTTRVVAMLILALVAGLVIGWEGQIMWRGTPRIVPEGDEDPIADLWNAAWAASMIFGYSSREAQALLRIANRAEKRDRP